MLDSIYHITLKNSKIAFWRENVENLPSFTQCYYVRHYVMLPICKPLVVNRFYCMVLYHSQRRHHEIKLFMNFCFPVNSFVYEKVWILISCLQQKLLTILLRFVAEGIFNTYHHK